MSYLIDPDRMEEIRPSLTDPKYGKEPESRTPEELLNAGFVPLDKPRGPTSHQVASWVKGIMGIEKAGHMGTLDPNTTGVLPVALGSSVRALSMTLSEGKQYVAVMEAQGDLDADLLRKLTDEFTGEIYQLVPVRSAVKRGLRTRRIERLKVLEVKNREALLLMDCESGTYVRTLIHDMGEVLGMGAHMAELRRTRSGTVRIDECVTLQELTDAVRVYRDKGDRRLFNKAVKPVENMLSHLGRIIIKDSAVDAVCHGAPLGHPGVVSVSKGLKEDETALISTIKGEAVAIGKTLSKTADFVKRRSGVAAQVERVLMEKGTYPRAWKKRSS